MLRGGLGLDLHRVDGGRSSFRFTGKIAKLACKLGPTQLTSEDHQVIQHALAKARDQSSKLILNLRGHPRKGMPERWSCYRRSSAKAGRTSSMIWQCPKKAAARRFSDSGVGAELGSGMLDEPKIAVASGVKAA